MAHRPVKVGDTVVFVDADGTERLATVERVYVKEFDGPLNLRVKGETVRRAAVMPETHKHLSVGGFWKRGTDTFGG